MGAVENTHTFLEWYREKEVDIVFVGEAWIEKNDRGTETHLSFVLIMTVKNGRRVMAYMRKGMEEEVEVVKEEYNLIILQAKNKKKIGVIYINAKWLGENWKDWLGKLEEEIEGEGSILEDGNAHSHSRDETREEKLRGKTME